MTQSNQRMLWLQKKFDSIDQLILIALSGWGAKLTCLALLHPYPALTLKAHQVIRLEKKHDGTSLELPRKSLKLGGCVSLQSKITSEV